jgi:hypothetical protein
MLLITETGDRMRMRMRMRGRGGGNRMRMRMGMGMRGGRKDRLNLFRYDWSELNVT